MVEAPQEAVGFRLTEAPVESPLGSASQWGFGRWSGARVGSSAALINWPSPVRAVGAANGKDLTGWTVNENSDSVLIKNGLLVVNGERTDAF